MEDVHTPFSSYGIRENPNSEGNAVLNDVSAILHVFSTFFLSELVQIRHRMYSQKCIG